MNEQIRTEIAKLPATFGLRGHDGTFRASEIHSYVNDSGKVTIYTERRNADGTWSAFAKGCRREIEREMIAPVVAPDDRDRIDAACAAGILPVCECSRCAPVTRETDGSIERKLSDGTTLITDKFRPSNLASIARETIAMIESDEIDAAENRIDRFGVACYYAEPTCHGILTRPGCCDACETDAHASGYRAAWVQAEVAK